MEPKKCSLCKGVILFDYIEVIAKIDNTEKKAILCKTCANIIFNKETFAVLRSISPSQLREEGNSIIIQKTINKRLFKIPPEEIDKILLVFIKKD